MNYMTNSEKQWAKNNGLKKNKLENNDSWQRAHCIYSYRW